MKKFEPLLPMFKIFLDESKSGKRLKKNGERIKDGTIKNYEAVFKNLKKFSTSNNFNLRACDATKLTQREYFSEKNYWKKFYLRFTKYLYKNDCHDNYVGSNIKTIRAFFNYLEHEKNFNTGKFHKSFYVRKEEVSILVLSPEQLKFLIHDTAFHDGLSLGQKNVKNMFVFGCTTGLRYSDLKKVTSQNFKRIEGDLYLNVQSQKTKTFSSMKLPKYAEDIYLEYRKHSKTKIVFPNINLNRFNQKLKLIGEMAGFTSPVEVSREIQGKTKPVNKEDIRFCDKMSSHMMRRTAITTMLILGMPEHLVRVVSGHGMGGTSFQRYVHYARSYTNSELDRVHEQLQAD